MRRQTGEYARRRFERVKSRSPKLELFKPNKRGYFNSAAALEHLLNSSWGKRAS